FVRLDVQSGGANTQVLIRLGSSTLRSFTLDQDYINSDLEFTLSLTAGGVLDLSIAGVSQGSISGVTSTLILRYIGRYENQYSASSWGVRRLLVTDLSNSTLIHDYDPSSTAGTGLVLEDTVGANNGTLLGYTGTVDSWWVDEGSAVVPTITLVGNSTVSITQNNAYTDAGATAVDGAGGDITGSIVIGGDTVDTSTIGAYVITYNVSTAVEVTRTVNVVAAVSIIANDNAAIAYSPYNWNITSGESKTICAGAYFKAYITASTCTLNFDITGLTAPLPRLFIMVDGIKQTIAEVASTVTVTFPTNQDNTRHLLEVYFDASSETVERWTTQANAIKFTGVDLSGGTISAITARP
ncbi:MAG: DUF5011 domain-containing protein, partial [Chloroflexi bacterium]|nr:DUF5011 domain-containing protein [Chloroflexota bacterium]